MQKELLLTKKDSDYIQFLKNRIFDDVPKNIASKMIKYALSKEQHNIILKKLENDILNNAKSQTLPKLHLIVSQTGGGKMVLKEYVKCIDKDAICINSDEYKKENSLSDFLLSNEPNLYGYLRALDSCLHRDELFEKAVNSKYDIILDIAPSIKYGLFNVDIKKLKELGYVIHYHILAVDIKQSLVSVFERYENQIEGKSENIKVPNVERLLDSFNAVEKLVHELENDNSNLKLYERSGYDNLENSFAVSEIKMDKNKTTFESFISARSKTLTESELNKRLNDIEQKMQKRNASKQEFQELQKAIEIIKLL